MAQGHRSNQRDDMSGTPSNEAFLEKEKQELQSGRKVNTTEERYDSRTREETLTRETIPMLLLLLHHLRVLLHHHSSLLRVCAFDFPPPPRSRA